ncbi:MAG: hypothetical protein L0Y68_00075, partial [Candidatus Dadabacteria bacterium]|nr:hypothetical protein [Candidatus Dadabacteria bacterium]
MKDSRLKVIKYTLFLFLLVFLPFIIEGNANALDRFVAPAPLGDDDNCPCETETTPCASIQEALDGDNCVAPDPIGPGNRIKVAEGLYEENVKFDLMSDIDLLGGFPIVAGVADYDDVDRNPILNPTTIDGDSPGLFIDASGSIFVTGFIIQNGIAIEECQDAQETEIVAGGGVLVNDSGGVILEDLFISSNTATDDLGDPGAGAGMAICNSTDVETRGSAQFDRCIISANIADGTDELNPDDIGGGGVFVLESSQVQFNNCQVLENKGNGLTGDETDGDGGGFYILDSTVGMEDVLIAGNDANEGGGIFINGSFAGILGDVLDLNRVVIRENFADDRDDGARGGGIYCENEATITTAGGAITRNQAEGTESGDEHGVGGGIYGNDCQQITLYGTPCTFNVADNDGGCAFIEDDTTLELEGDLIIGNIAREGDGGGIYLDTDSFLNIHEVDDIFPSAINDNQAGNAGTSSEDSSGRGGGIYCENGGSINIGTLDGSVPIPEARTQIIGNRANGGEAPGNVGDDNEGAGGGIFVGFQCSLEVKDALINDNRAVGPGGGIAFDNFEDDFEGDPGEQGLAVGDLQRVEINRNMAEDPGGGIFIGNACDENGENGLPFCGGKVFVRDSDILENVAECDFFSDFPGCGGGVGVGKGLGPQFTSDLEMTNVCLAANKAGGDFLAGNGGGLSVVQAGNVITNHLTITDNSADGQGGGVFVADFASLVTLENDIVWNNTAPTLFVDGEPINAGAEGRDIFCGPVIAELNLINSIAGNSLSPRDVFIDPLCILKDNGFNKFLTRDFIMFVSPGNRNYHLTNFAPAINMANNSGPSLDKDGNGRSCNPFPGCNQSMVADIGALEFTGLDCTDNCDLPQCILTPECEAFRCDQVNVDCNEDVCFADPECQEGVAFNNCDDGINNNPLQNPFTDCSDPNCSGAALCQPTPPPTPQPTAVPTATPTATATVAPT